MTLGTKPGISHISPVRPLLVGDRFEDRDVAGFAWVAPRDDSASTHLDDRLLFVGDEHLTTPPDRMVPQTVDGAESAAVMPPDDLPLASRHEAGLLEATLPLRAGKLLDLPGAPWQPLIRPLLGAAHAAGHRVWLSGGAARDLVAGLSPHEVRDLDLAGTVPPGRFTDITRQTLRAMGMSEFRTTISPSSLVCSVVRPKSADRLIEYRGLSKGGFQFPVVGSRLFEDSQYRDFAFNALMYDVLHDVVIDASGRGLDDLLGEKRQFTPRNFSADPYTQADVVVRAAKFALRWCAGAMLDLTTVDLEPLKTWIIMLPPKLCQILTPAQWSGLISKYRHTVQAPEQHQRTFAAALPEPGRELLQTLIRGVR